MKLTDIKAGDLVEVFVEKSTNEIVGRLVSGPQYLKEIFPVFAVLPARDMVIMDVTSKKLGRSIPMTQQFANSSTQWFDRVGGTRVTIDSSQFDIKSWAVFLEGIIRVVPTSEAQALTRTGPDGMNCNNCSEFCPMAISNQKDGSMRCYQCRQDPWSRRWHK